MKHIRILLATIRKADKNFNLIAPNDKIVVGISGGKDSMALFYALHLYRKFSQNNFELYPCMINLGFGGEKPTKIINFLADLGYSLKILEEPQVYQILKIQQEKQKLPHLPCSICSRVKKAVINKYANSIGVKKVSFAHHLDDALETLFLNEIYGGRIATFSPKMHLENEDITFIRPFIYTRENDIRLTVAEENIPILPSHCPNDKFTQRESIKNLLGEIYKNYPAARENFLTMIENQTKEDIFYMHEDHKIEKTDYSYKMVRTINDYIDYKSIDKSKINAVDKDTFKYLIYKKGELIGAAKIKKNKPREYELVTLISKDKTAKEMFLDDIKAELYARYNPYTFLEK